MDNTNKRHAQHLSVNKVRTICDVEIPLTGIGRETRYEYIKFECGDVVRWNARKQQFLLMQTCDHPDQRRISISIFDNAADMVYYVKEILTQEVNSYKLLKIYTRHNFWHDVLKTWPYVKYAVQQYQD